MREEVTPGCGGNHVSQVKEGDVRGRCVAYWRMGLMGTGGAKGEGMVSDGEGGASEGVGSKEV